MAFTYDAFVNSIAAPITYAVLTIIAYAAVYRLMGVNKHFVITSEQDTNHWFASFYISLMAQTNAMGDATPKTIAGRTVFASQTVLGWFWFAVLTGVVEVIWP